MGTEKESVLTKAAIRRIAFWDLKAVAAIEQSSYHTPWDKDQLEALLIQPDVEGWGLYLGNRIVAYGILRYRTRHAFLETLTVDRRYRRRGYASSLVNYLCERAARHGSRCLVLEVHESNLPAQLLLKRLRFTVTKVLRRYFEDGSDAYLMTRRLLAPQSA